MMRICRSIIGLAVCMACTAAYGSVIIHVDNLNGNDGNDGRSPGTAVATFARAMSLSTPGGGLNIANTGKPYYESLFLRGGLGEKGKDFVVEGNNAVISGLRNLNANEFIDKGNGVFYLKIGKRNSNVNPRMFVNDRQLPEAAKTGELGEGEFRHADEGFYFRPESGKRISDYPLQGSTGDSGVLFIHARNVTVRNLISEHNANDGFNLHGSCHGITIENVVGRNNGDDGFSAHEDVEVQVRDSVFHGNVYGIEDVNASVSGYRNVTVHDNAIGVHFSGGIHTLISCDIRDNGIQLVVDPGAPSVYLGTDRAPMIFGGKSFVKNCRISGKDNGIKVGNRVSLTLIGSDVNSGKCAIELLPGSELYMLTSVVKGQPPLRARQAKIFGDRNMFHPDSFMLDGKAVDIQTFKRDSNSNSMSFCEEARYKDGKVIQQPFMDKSPRIGLGTDF